MRNPAKLFFSVLFYVGVVVLVAILLVLVIPWEFWPIRNDLQPQELSKADYRYLVFGSQRTEGIRAYEFATGKFKDIIPTGGQGRYIFPCVSLSGKGVCLKDSKYDEVVSFDLKTGQHAPLQNLPRTQYHNVLALSHDGNSVALIFNKTDGEYTPILGIYDLGTGQIIKTYELGERLKETPISMFWAPNDKELVVVWRKYTKIPTIIIDVGSGKRQNLPYHLEAFKDDVTILVRDEKSKLFLLDQGTGAKKPLEVVSEYKTAHTFSFSRDGKYLVYGWLRGKGFETLVVVELSSGRKLQLKLDDHPSTILGLTLL